MDAEGYPKFIADGWEGLKGAGFDRDVKAVVNWGNGKAYFFKGDKYVRFDIKADKMDEGYPKYILDAALVDTKDGLSKEEQQVLDLTNAERKKAGLEPLKPSAKLMALARDHSKNMAKQNKMDHTLDDKSPFDRMKDAGLHLQCSRENIAGNYATPEKVHRGLDESSGAQGQHPRRVVHGDRHRPGQERQGRTLLDAGLRQTPLNPRRERTPARRR